VRLLIAGAFSIQRLEGSGLEFRRYGFLMWNGIARRGRQLQGKRFSERICGEGRQVGSSRCPFARALVNRWAHVQQSHRSTPYVRDEKDRIMSIVWLPSVGNEAVLEWE
jgi:hypothetical protein